MATYETSEVLEKENVILQAFAKGSWASEMQGEAERFTCLSLRVARLNVS